MEPMTLFSGGVSLNGRLCPLIRSLTPTRNDVFNVGCEGRADIPRTSKLKENVKVPTLLVTCTVPV